METTLRTALWPQFGAAIDMLNSAIAACPTQLWTRRLWDDPPDHPVPPWLPPEFAEFWYVAYHTLFWLDLYLSGRPEEEFTPPAPFIWTENYPAVSPERPYTKDELQAYLAALRRKCRDTLAALTDERASQTVEYPWTEGQTVSFLELLFYNMRHVVEHTAQLSLFLGQRDAPDIPNMVTRAKDELGSQA
jgi:uncharacterized damage-inducible protein DinB